MRIPKINSDSLTSFSSAFNFVHVAIHLYATIEHLRLTIFYGLVLFQIVATEAQQIRINDDSSSTLKTNEDGSMSFSFFQDLGSTISCEQRPGLKRKRNQQQMDLFLEIGLG